MSTEHSGYIISLDIGLNESLIKFLLSGLVVLLIQFVIFALSRNFYISILLNSIVIMMFYYIHKYKIIYLGNPFLPWDLKLVNQFIGILPFFYSEFNLIHILISMVVIIVLIIFIIKYSDFVKVNNILRICLLCIPILTLTILSNYPNNFLYKVYKENNILSVPENQVNHHNINGFVLFFS